MCPDHPGRDDNHPGSPPGDRRVRAEKCGGLLEVSTPTTTFPLSIAGRETTTDREDRRGVKARETWPRRSVRRGTLKGHEGWVTAIPSPLGMPSTVILSSSRDKTATVIVFGPKVTQTGFQRDLPPPTWVSAPSRCGASPGWGAPGGREGGPMADQVRRGPASGRLLPPAPPCRPTRARTNADPGGGREGGGPPARRTRSSSCPGGATPAPPPKPGDGPRAG